MSTGATGIGSPSSAETASGRRSAPRRSRWWPRPASSSTPPTSTSGPPATCATAPSCPTRRSRSCGASTPSCSVPSGPPSATPPSRRAPSSGACCCGSASSSTSTSTCVPSPACPGSIAEGADFAVVRENTEGTYAGEGGFLRKGTPHEVATQGSVNTRMGVERCVRFAFDLAGRPPGPAPHPGAQDERADLRRRPVAPHRDRGRGRAPRRRLGLQPRRRRLHLPGRAAEALRRDRHRQPLRRHPHRPGRRRRRRHRLRRVGQPQPGPHRTLALRAGARRRPRHRGPGHRQPAGRHPLGRARCSTTWARPTPPAASSRPSPPRPIPCQASTQELSTTAVGDAIAERL